MGASSRRSSFSSRPSSVPTLPSRPSGHSYGAATDQPRRHLPRCREALLRGGRRRREPRQRHAPLRRAHGRGGFPAHPASSLPAEAPAEARADAGRHRRRRPGRHRRVRRRRGVDRARDGRRADLPPRSSSSPTSAPTRVGTKPATCGRWPTSTATAGPTSSPSAMPGCGPRSRRATAASLPRSSSSPISAPTTAGMRRGTCASWRTSTATAGPTSSPSETRAWWTALSTGDGGFALNRFVLADFGCGPGLGSREARAQRRRHRRRRAGADIVAFGDAGVWTALSTGRRRLRAQPVRAGRLRLGSGLDALPARAVHRRHQRRRAGRPGRLRQRGRVDRAVDG